MASIWDILLHGTTGDAHCWSLPNVKGEGRERWISGRQASKLDSYAKKKDEPGYGVFFCVSAIAEGQPRKKDHAEELRFLFADVDFKNIDLSPEQIERALRALPLPPSRMHHTGNGIHCFWLLDRPILRDGMEQAEILLRRLANHLGADPQVAHRVALLRVPGSHNSKRGEWRTVTLIREGRETYTLEEISAWLGSAVDPAMVRRGAEQNPFLRTAQEQAFRPPVDVEARLAAMEPGGADDLGVHATHLSCTASLIHAGVPEDEIVEQILNATRDMAGTEGWDWGQEERTIRAMCRDFERKLDRRVGLSAQATPRDITGALQSLVNEDQSQSNPQPPPENVVSLSQAREHRNKDKPTGEPPKLKKQKNEHVVIGMGIQAQLADDGKRIMYADNQCWMYEGGVWKAMDADAEKSWINRKVEEGCCTIGLVSTTKIVNETRAWLQRQPGLHQDRVDWDGHGYIATKSGLVDWQDGSVEPLQPEDYVTRLVDCHYTPDASCPIWEAMLRDDYGFDRPTVAFMQEFVGTCLVTKKPRGLMRALVLLGPSNTGKSNILNVIAGLISAEQNPTPLQVLENAHGLMQFLRPNPWVLHEAFEQSRWEMSATAKALLSGDQVNVNVKNGPLVPLKFIQPILWGSNVPPQFKEASRAMENRLAIVAMRRAFDPMQVTGTAAQAHDEGKDNPAQLVLDTEKSGLLNWAIAGLKRAWQRKHFNFTEEMMLALHQMRTESNMALGFIEECAEYDAEVYIHTADFYGAFSTWWREHRGGQLPSHDSLGRAMHALSDARLVVGERINKKRVYGGIKLNEEGLNCWQGHYEVEMTRGSGQRLSRQVGEVNRLLTFEHLQRVRPARR